MLPTTHRMLPKLGLPPPGSPLTISLVGNAALCLQDESQVPSTLLGAWAPFKHPHHQVDRKLNTDFTCGCRPRLLILIS